LIGSGFRVFRCRTCGILIGAWRPAPLLRAWPSLPPLAEPRRRIAPPSTWAGRPSPSPPAGV